MKKDYLPLRSTYATSKIVIHDNHVICPSAACLKGKYCLSEAFNYILQLKIKVKSGKK